MLSSFSRTAHYQGISTPNKRYVLRTPSEVYFSFLSGGRSGSFDGCIITNNL